MGIKLTETFKRDAIRSLTVLDELILKAEFDEDEMHSYTVTVHGMKSALAHMGKSDLSAAALKLALLARNNMSELAAETPDFILLLRSYTEELSLS